MSAKEKQVKSFVKVSFADLAFFLPEMPTIKINDVEIYYEEHGSGEEAIVFSHGLLFSGEMFAAQVAVFKDRYRCITYDHRGQGQTPVTKDGYDMDTLTNDAAALIEKLNCAPCHFVGLSMGGFVGMRLAIRRPELLKSLTLMETSADPEPVDNVPKYKKLGIVARWLSMKLVINKVMPIMFGQKFMNDESRAGEREKWKGKIISADRVGINRALVGVITRKGVYEQLDKINTPTLIIVGNQDTATVPAKSERMHARIKNSKFVIIEGAGHSSSVEEPEQVNKAIEEFCMSKDNNR